MTSNGIGDKFIFSIVPMVTLTHWEYTKIMYQTNRKVSKCPKII